MTLKMTIDDMHAFIDEVFPAVINQFEVIELTEEGITVRMKVDENHIRPGGTVYGPAMFALADVAYYLVTLSRIGPKALTVTTNCSIDFMRRPKPCDLIAKAKILKLGKSLSVGDVLIYSEGDPKPVARASLTYSIPPQ